MRRDRRIPYSFRIFTKACRREKLRALSPFSHAGFQPRAWLTPIFWKPLLMQYADGFLKSDSLLLDIFISCLLIILIELPVSSLIHLMAIASNPYKNRSMS